ncbi:MAG: alpha/beta hydrolase [Pseudomonadota bacterium]
MSLLKTFSIGFAAMLTVVIAVALGWSVLPPGIDREAPDQGVLLLNERSSMGPVFKEAYFEYEQLRLHYVEAGTGPPVVFLHGFPSVWFSVIRQIVKLAADHRVIAIDGLGAGKSDAPGDIAHYKLEAMSRHILALLDALHVDRAHVVGHDWGSALAIGLAQRHPDRVLSVTGISAPPLNAILYGLEADSEAKDTASYVERFKKANPLLLVALNTADSIFQGAYRPLVDDAKLSKHEGELFREATSDPRRVNAHINWYRANIPAPQDIAEVDFWPSRDARVGAPALYIWGDQDPIYNQTAIDRLLALSDGAELLKLPGVDHWPHIREAELVNAAIRENLRRAPPR